MTKYKNEVQDELTKTKALQNEQVKDLQTQIQSLNYKNDEMEPKVKAVYEKISHIETMVINFEVKFEELKKDVIALDHEKVNMQEYRED